MINSYRSKKGLRCNPQTPSYLSSDHPVQYVYIVRTKNSDSSSPILFASLALIRVSTTTTATIQTQGGKKRKGRRRRRQHGNESFQRNRLLASPTANVASCFYSLIPTLLLKVFGQDAYTVGAIAKKLGRRIDGWQISQL